MKKSIKIIMIIVVAFVILALIGVFTYIFLNKEKESITIDDFKNIMEQKEFKVEAKELFSGISEVEKVYVAVDSSNNYNMYFFEIIDDNSANMIFNGNKEILENSAGNVSVKNSISASNYAKFTIESNGQYAVISKIDNTIIYLIVDDEYKENVKEILKEIGY